MSTRRIIVSAQKTEEEIVTKLQSAAGILPNLGTSVLDRRTMPSAGLNPINVLLVELTTPNDSTPPVTDYLARLRALEVEGAPDRELARVGLLPAPPSRPELPSPQPYILHTPTLRGKGVGIAVIDPDGMVPHTAFGDRLTTFVLKNGKFIEGPHDVGVGDDHGTAVASVAALAATESTILAYQCHTVWEMMKAIDHTTKRPEVCVIVTACTLPEKEGQSDADKLEQTIESARKARIAMVAAAGNEGPNEKTIHEPAIYPAVITIGGFEDGTGSVGTASADAKDKVGTKSSRGSKETPHKPNFLEFYGPYRHAVSDGGFEKHAGTSLAVGRAGGIIATLYGDRGGRANVTVAEVLSMVNSACIDLKDSNSKSVPSWHQGRGALSESSFEAKVLGIL